MKNNPQASLALAAPLLLAASFWFRADVQGEASFVPAVFKQAQEEEPTGDTARAAAQAKLERLVADISVDVADLRELEWKHPVKATLADRDTVRRYLRERLLAMDSPEELARTEFAAQLLGLMPAEKSLEELMVSFLDEQAGGFYDPLSKGFFLMEGVEGALAESTIAHELVHALEDQHFDLEKMLVARKDDSDSAAALHAVMEGGALAIQQIWMQENFSPDQFVEVMQASQSQSEGLFATPEFLWKPTMASYMVGLEFLSSSEGKAAGLGSIDPEILDAAYLNPPRSTEQLLHPELYWDEAQREAPADLQLELNPAAGYRAVFQDSFGEISLGILVDPKRDQQSGTPSPMDFLSMKFTSTAVTGWGADRIVVFEHESGPEAPRVVMLITRWDDEAEALEFAGALGQVLPQIQASARLLGHAEHGGASWSRRGTDVTLVVFEDASQLPDGYEGWAKARSAELPR